MNNYKFLLDPMRLPFLVLTPACVVLGLGTALWTNSQVNWVHFILVLIGALAAHISVNIFNEYFDFKSGLDSKTVRTPFSGGSGRLPKKPGNGGLSFIVGLDIFGNYSCYRFIFLVCDRIGDHSPGSFGGSDHLFLY